MRARRCIDRELQRGHAAVGMSGDVRGGDAEMVEQGDGVGGDLGDRAVLVGRRVVEATATIGDELVRGGELLGDHLERVGDHPAVDEEERLPGTAHLVFELDAVSEIRLHGLPPRTTMNCASRPPHALAE